MPVEVLPEMTLVMPKKEDLFGGKIMNLIAKFKRWAEKCGWFLLEEEEIGDTTVLKYMLPEGVNKNVRIDNKR